MLRARSHAVHCAQRAARSPCYAGGGRGRGASACAKTLAESNCQLPVSESRFQGSHVVDQQRVQQTLQVRGKGVDASGASNDVLGQQGHAGGQECSLQKAPGMRQRTPGATLTTRLRSMFTHKGGGPWRLAVHVLEKARKEGIKDVKAYNAVLKMIAVDEWMREDKLKQMEVLFQQMKMDGLEPEVHTYNSLIHAYGQAGKEERAVRLYGEMMEGGVQPDRRTLSSMIVAHSWGSVNCMRRVAAEMKARGWLATRRAHSAMIGKLHREEDWKGVVHIAEMMLESKQTLTEAGFAVAIKGARCLGQADLGRKFLADYGRARFRPKEALYASVMEGFRSAGRHEDCLACWRELVVLDGLGGVNVSERTYNLALRSAVKAERWEEMEGIFDMMQARGVEPNEETYKSLAGTPGGAVPLNRAGGAAQQQQQRGGGWRPRSAGQQQLSANTAKSGSTGETAWRKARSLAEIAGFKHGLACRARAAGVASTVGDIIETARDLAEVKGLGLAPSAEGAEAVTAAERGDAELKGWRLAASTNGAEALAAAAESGDDVVANGGKAEGGGGDVGDVSGGMVEAGGNDGDPSLRPENETLAMGSPEAIRFGVPDRPACETESPWVHEAWSAKKLRKRDELMG